MEYAVLVAMIAVTLMAAVSAVSSGINSKFKTISQAVTSAGR